jgi:hypothetical protein
VKIIITRGQSAVVQNIILYFETIQRLILNIQKIKMNKIFKIFYTTVSKFSSKYKSNVKGLSYGYLVGLIEGDG